jgi:hypothetical protein
MAQPQRTPQITFTWLDGTQIQFVSDYEDWSARELRQADAIAEGPVGRLSALAFRGIQIVVSVARATGQRIAEVDAQLTVRQLSKISAEINARMNEIADQAQAAAGHAVAAAAAPAEQPAQAGIASDQAPAQEPPASTSRVVDFTAHSTITVAATDPGPAAAAAPAGDGGEVLSPSSAGSVQPA